MHAQERRGPSLHPAWNRQHIAGGSAKQGLPITPIDKLALAASLDLHAQLCSRQRLTSICSIVELCSSATKGRDMTCGLPQPYQQVYHSHAGRSAVNAHRKMLTRSQQSSQCPTAYNATCRTSTQQGPEQRVRARRRYGGEYCCQPTLSRRSALPSTVARMRSW